MIELIDKLIKGLKIEDDADYLLIGLLERKSEFLIDKSKELFLSKTSVTKTEKRIALTGIHRVIDSYIDKTFEDCYYQSEISDEEYNALSEREVKLYEEVQHSGYEIHRKFRCYCKENIPDYIVEQRAIIQKINRKLLTIKNK